uniref:Uncharacterized protein n=1 Tax=Strigops habroptila TaxID=2489341 RepID=A0A672UN80_STRHB
MHGHQQCRCGNKDQLQGPESDVRDGEKVIIANISAARLKCVADKILLFISPDSLCSHNQDHDTEDEQDCEPDLPNAGGGSPVHLLFCVLLPNKHTLIYFSIRL